MPGEDEIQSIIREEKSRGVRRKRVDTEERRKDSKSGGWTWQECWLQEMSGRS